MAAPAPEQISSDEGVDTVDESPVLAPIDGLAGQHIADLEPGTEAEQIVALLGPPDSVESDGIIMEATGTAFETWEYPNHGLTITLERADEENAWAAWLTAVPPWDGVMPCGLHIGMSEADATLVLGDEARIIDEDEWESLSVIFQGGRVTQISYSQMGE